MHLHNNIPTMLSEEIRDYLAEIGSSWSGAGYAVECGAWLGGGTAALATGLSEAGYDLPLCVYDKWQANREEVFKAKFGNVPMVDGQNIEPIFRDFATPYCEGFPIKTYRGRIEQAKWCGHPIEIWLLDAAKREGPFYGALKAFGPSWIPGVTTVGLLDYGFYRQFGDDDPKGELYLEQVAFMDRFSDRFELMEDFGPSDSPAFFKYVEEIDWEDEI